LPYLQVFLDKFYLHVSNDESRQSEATFSVASLKEMGDLGDILRNFLDHQVLQMAHDLQLTPDQVWLMLSPLVTLEGTKEPTTLQMLAARLPEMPMDTLQKALEAFVQHRILRLNEQAQAYEVAHDALARQIHAKRSDAEIAILEVQRLVKAQMSLKVAVRDYFTEKQLLFMEPYLPKFVLSAAEQQWIGESRAFRTEEKRAEERRKAEELTHAQETAQLEKAERQRQLAKQRSRIAIGVALVALTAAVAAGWLYQKILQSKKYIETINKKIEEKNNILLRHQVEKDSLLEKLIESVVSNAKEFQKEAKFQLNEGYPVNAQRLLNRSALILDSLKNRFDLEPELQQLDFKIAVLEQENEKLMQAARKKAKQHPTKQVGNH
jgi:hypothetical protein